mgnify:FL=1
MGEKEEYISSTSIKTVREQYLTRLGLLPFAGNYSHDRRFASTNWLCRCKQTREEESHLISGKCPIFGDLTKQFGDLSDDSNLVQFFREVLERRDQLDQKDNL